MAKGGKSIWKIVLVGFVVLIAVGSFGSGGADEPVEGGSPQKSQVQQVQEPEPEPDVPTEYRSALKKAETYSKMMHMSKQGIYDQLTSEYGERFTQEEADYAVANLS